MTLPDHERAFLDALESLGLPPAEKTAAAEGALHSDTIPAPAATVTYANIWRHPDAHPLTLDILLLDKYGVDWLSWEAETLRTLIPEDFKTSSVSELNIAKVQACKALHLVDSFWQRWEVFIACLMPFNSEFPNFHTMPVPTVAQVLVACDIADSIRDDVPWSSEMKAYIATVYEHEGIFVTLPPANFVTLNVPEEINVAAVLKRWPAVRDSRQAPTGQTPDDEQLRRLLTVNEYLEESRARFRRQPTHA